MTIPFSSPTLHDRAAVFEAACASKAMENDAAFASIYLLRHKYRTQIAKVGEQLLRFYGAGIRENCYGFPLGCGDIGEAVALMHEDANTRGIPFRMGLLTHEMCEALEAAFPHQFSFLPVEGYTEYLYLQENLANLSGSKYHKKRNHIAQFRRAYPEAEIHPLTIENANFAVNIAKAWLMSRENPQDTSLQGEFACIQEATAHFDTLGLSGLLLYAEGKPIGMTIVSEISLGIADVHYEKVLPEFPHAWPVVANEMARCLPNALYLNREEDLGTDGMRSSKTSYRPDLLQEKYIAVWDKKE